MCVCTSLSRPFSLLLEVSTVWERVHKRSRSFFLSLFCVWKWNVPSGICWSFEKIAFDVSSVEFALRSSVGFSHPHIHFALRWSPIYIIAKLFVRKSHDSGHVIYLFHIIFFLLSLSLSNSLHSSKILMCRPIAFFHDGNFILSLCLGETLLSFTLSSLFAFLFSNERRNEREKKTCITKS